MPAVYILHSEKDKKFYVGSTNDLARRLEEHFRGSEKATKNRRPLKLAYNKEFNTLLEARRWERYIKKQKSRLFIEKLILDSK